MSSDLFDNTHTDPKGDQLYEVKTWLGVFRKKSVVFVLLDFAL